MSPALSDKEENKEEEEKEKVEEVEKLKKRSDSAELRYYKTDRSAESIEISDNRSYQTVNYPPLGGEEKREEYLTESLKYLPNRAKEMQVKRRAEDLLQTMKEEKKGKEKENKLDIYQKKHREMIELMQSSNKPKEESKGEATAIRKDKSKKKKETKKNKKEENYMIDLEVILSSS